MVIAEEDDSEGAVEDMCPEVAELDHDCTQRGTKRALGCGSMHCNNSMAAAQRWDPHLVLRDGAFYGKAPADCTKYLENG